MQRRLVFASMLLAMLLPAHAWAMFSPETEDAIADVMVWVVLILVPIGALYLFWELHILPEKVAEKRHHPQKDAIQALCLLSLAFGGLLWPFAMLWAYVKPIGHQIAYGRDKHDEYYEQDEAAALDAPPSTAGNDPSLEAMQHQITELQRQLEAYKQAQPSAVKPSSNAA